MLGIIIVEEQDPHKANKTLYIFVLFYFAYCLVVVVNT